MGNRVLVAMSGGVDSSVAALLLQRQGWEVCGATFELFDGCAESNVADAAAVCRRLGIPHMVFDYRRLFAEKVLDYFVNTYQAGKTPNPCVACNRGVKFGAFADDAEKLGFTHISTGHYAQVYYDEGTRLWGLRRAGDEKKDQSYVLYHLDQRQLSMLALPLQAYTKEQVRALAAEAGLSVTSKSDSQDICFVPDGDYVSFIERYTGKRCQEGDYLDEAGNVIGRHKGVLRYTIGQRKGLGVSFGVHRFVSALDAVNNTVTLSDERAVFHKALEGEDLRMIGPVPSESPLRVCAKIRYAHKPAPASVYFLDRGRVRVVFDAPQRAITAGQAVVFYDGSVVLGGAVITGCSD